MSDREYRREQYRRLYASREDGLVVKKYSPDQWELADLLLSRDHSIAYVAQQTRMSYNMVWKIAHGYFSFGKRELKEE